MRIGLVELPAIKLCDQHGRNWTAFRHHEPLVSKQILLAQLRALGFDAALVNLKSSSAEHTFGEVSWRNLSLRKIFVGNSIEEYPADAFDLWGFTINYMQEREIACDFIRYLKVSRRSRHRRRLRRARRTERLCRGGRRGGDRGQIRRDQRGRHQLHDGTAAG